MYGGKLSVPSETVVNEKRIEVVVVEIVHVMRDDGVARTCRP